jgi:hypothetical protein
MDKENNVSNDENGIWKWKFWLKNELNEIYEVWNKFDDGGWKGKEKGIRLRIDNGI